MNILVFETLQAWVDGGVALWTARLRQNPHLRLCLPSGNTPTPLYTAMGQEVKAGRASFANVELFALDEFGGLAPGDQGRCRNMLTSQLINQTDLPAHKFHTLDVDAPDLNKICAAYDEKLKAPLDLVLLGIGLNGHLGLNEPRTPIEIGTHRAQMAESTIKGSAAYLTHGNLPTWGLAVGLKHLLRAKEVWVIARGESKADIIANTLLGPVTNQVPASLLRDHPNCYFLLDAAAASKLLRPALE